MKSIDEIYKPRFFKQHVSMAWRAPIVCGAIMNIFNPLTVIDVGCGVGDIVSEFLKHQVRAYGIEGANNSDSFLMCPKDRIIKHDLRVPLISLPFGTPGSFEVVLSLEVAEHIEPEYVDIFITTLQALAKNWIMMTAAPPGQEGTYHKNCQQKDYWVEKIEKFGFQRMVESEKYFMECWKPWGKKRAMRAYCDNLLVFRRNGKDL